MGAISKAFKKGRQTVEDVIPGNIGKDYSSKAEAERNAKKNKGNKKKGLSARQKTAVRNAFRILDELIMMEGYAKSTGKSGMMVQASASRVKSELITAFPFLGTS